MALNTHPRVFTLFSLFFTTLLFLSSSAFAVLPLDNPLKMPAKTPGTTEIIGSLSGDQEVWTFETVGGSAAWNARRFDRSGSIGLAYGHPLPIFPDVTDFASVGEASRIFVRQVQPDLGLAGFDLKIESIRRVHKYTVVSLIPEFDGIPVYDAFIVLSINSEGKLSLLKARGYGSDLRGSYKLTDAEAIQSARLATGIEAGEADCRRVLLPVQENISHTTLSYAYEVNLFSLNPALQPAVYVDGSTGDILASINNVMSIELTGLTQGLHFPHYGSEDQDTAIFPMEKVMVTREDSIYSDEAGEFSQDVAEDDFPVTVESSLLGLWVEVSEFEDDVPNAYFEAVAENADESFGIMWNDDNSSSDERNLYVHVNKIHDFWKTVEPEFDGLDYPINAVCGMGGAGLEALEDNAFSSAQGIFFGRGRQLDNFALYADVVYHEYNHSVTAEVYGVHPLPYEEESGALNEGWSDYFACSLTDESAIGEGGLMGVGRVMRNLDNNMHYPEDIENEVHADSRIVSAAMWHTREVLGSDLSDSLFHFARYHYAREFTTYLADVFLTDDDDGDLTNGTPHYAEIFEAFFRHGITAVELPVFIIKSIDLSDAEEDGAEGDGNGLFEPGEIIRINMEIFRGGWVNENDGGNVVVRIRSEHEGFDPINNDVVIEDIPLGGWGETPEPLTFEILEGIDLSYCDIVFYMGPEHRQLEAFDTLRIVLGRPQLLLVKDGEHDEDITSYLQEPLDEMGIIYGSHATASGRLAADDYLDNFEAVIWHTGNARQNMLSEPSREALAAYLEQGGSLLLTGQEAGTAEGAEDFFNEYLGARNVVDSLHQVYLEGVEDDAISDRMNLLLIGRGSAQNQRRPGGIEALEPAVEIFHWSRMDEPLAGGVRLENPETGAKSVYLSFGIESISDTPVGASRAVFLESVLHWFDFPNEVSDETGLVPASFSIGQPYPNPFNSRVMIPFSLSQSGRMSAALFDLNGRELWTNTSMHHSGNGFLTLDASKWGAGMYFLQIEAQGVTQSRRVMLVK